VEQNVRSALSVADRSVVMALGRVTTVDVSDATLRHAYLGF
jgi:branched-chain amino acid transport system ATP-binding protein